MKLAVLQFIIMFSIVFTGSIFIGAFTAYETKYLLISNWDVLPRGIVTILSVLLGLINTFRDDGKII